VPKRVEPPSNEMRGWTPALRDFVQAEQERRYRRLADALGLGPDPVAAYTRLSNSDPLNDELPDQIRALGYYQDLSDGQFEYAKQFLNATVKPYYEAPLPTRYENPEWYPPIVLGFDEVHGAMAREDQGIDPPPLVATLPSGDINARTIQDPASGRHIIFFEHGLFKFIDDFAWLVAWAFPEITPVEMMDDRKLQRLNIEHDIPGQAARLFTGILSSYVVNGNPATNVEWKNFPWPKHNLYLHHAIMAGMEYFVISHELSHITLGHLAQTPSAVRQSWDLELEADLHSAGIVTALMNEKLGLRANALSFWSCDLMLTAMHLLNKTLCLFAFGNNNLKWISATHPDPQTRRRHIWSGFANAYDIPEHSVRAAEHLFTLSDAIFPRLMENSRRDWSASYHSGARPSPLWNNTIRSSIEPITFQDLNEIIKRIMK
jgi:hypothetical protein